jgi:hypothetical protein
MSDRWAVTVTNVSREYLGVPNDKGFWVSYILLDGNFPDYHGHRLVVAQDELEVYTRFPLMMLKRHGANNVRWLPKEVV